MLIEIDRKVIYRKIHRYGKKEYLIEISKTKVKYFIISIRMNKNQKTQVLEFHYKQGKKLIKSAGGVEALADLIKFKYGTLAIQDLNKLLYQSSQNGQKSMKELAIRKSPRGQVRTDEPKKMLTTTR
jgi:hypothetical protein